jgi:hypothetical protein
MAHTESTKIRTRETRVEKGALRSSTAFQPNSNVDIRFAGNTQNKTRSPPKTKQGDKTQF